MPQPRPLHPGDAYDLEDDSAVESVAANAVEPPVVDANEGERSGPVKRRAAPPWRLLAGDFAFPWTRGALARWLLISMWALIPLWLIRSALMLGIGSSGNLYAEIVALLSAMGALLFGCACAAVAAIHGLTILTETSAGNHRIECWPNVAMFLDWLGHVFYVVNAAAISAALACGLGWLLPAARGPVTGCTMFLVFPFLLLCELEANSAFVPVSALVVSSIRRRGLAWLLFYLKAIGLLAAAGALLHYVRPSIGDWLGIVLAALLFAAVVMIYFRLLGRLAYHCSVETPRKAVTDE